MREVLRTVIVSAVALALVFAALVLGGDATTVVPAPESVGEQFARQIAARRYERALQYVDERSGITFITVRLGGEALHSRAGAIHQVEGEPGRIEAARATASAVLRTAHAGRVRYRYRLARRNGMWRIVEWEVH